MSSFCKDVLTSFVIGGICLEIYKRIKIIREKSQLKKLLLQIKEELERVTKLNQTLEALEKEIKASQNEELLRLHEALVKNIKDFPDFELEE